MTTTSRRRKRALDFSVTVLQKLVKDIRTSKAVKKTIIEEKKGLAMLPNTNPLYPTFSDAVKIEYEEGRGRFAVAKREVSG